MTVDETLRAKAMIWRNRPPSGKFVMHSIARPKVCPKYGRVSRYHCCPICTPNICGDVVIAKSAWMGKVPTGPAKGCGG